MLFLVQQLGAGLEGLRAILSHLGLSQTVGNKSKCRAASDALGVAQKAVAKHCVVENRRQESLAASKNQSPLQFDRENDCFHQGIGISGDAGEWQKRASGWMYSSLSGHFMMIGVLTGKILAYNVFSKVCRVCDEYERKSKQPGFDKAE